MTSLLKLDRVSVALGATQAIDEISFSIFGGEIVALLGANGAGKTTLIRAALGLVRTGRGRIELGGADPVRLSARTRALLAAYMPQKPQTAWPIPVENLVALGRFVHGGAPERLSVQDKAAVDAALEACALNELLRRRMDEISGGERMRAHLARTLAQGAPLLMLDEPTAGLDPAQSLGVAEILRRHAADGGAVVMATHDIGLAAACAHRVLLLQTGRMIAEGEPEKALTPEAIEAAYGRKGRIERFGGSVAALFE